jgi:hypothetical protein
MNPKISFMGMDEMDLRLTFNEVTDDYAACVHIIRTRCQRFHWIKPEIGFPKVCRLLKSRGVFAWISIQPAPADRSVHNELKKVYEKYKQYFGGEKLEFDSSFEVQRKQTDRIDTFRQYGFNEIADKLYYGKRTLNASDYATLCGTHSDHRAIPEADRIPFLFEIEDAVNRCGGSFTFADTFLLCMGRKP